MLTLPDPEQLARAVASALTARLATAQLVHGTASLVLTGGGIGTAVLTQVPTLPPSEHRPVDWSAVDVWWSDERFVPADDAQRNEVQARRALLEPIGVPEDRVHAMPPSDAGFSQPEDAAAWYAEQLAAAATMGQQLPHFDVLLLGMGTEGHVASIFPGPEVGRDDRVVVAVRNCPKPPPTRLSMTLSTINTAAEVWLVVAGQAKAATVAAALSGADPRAIPAAGVHGVIATRWWLDASAAGELPLAYGGS
ncbi:6-phosphogluconolactonase [Blastococcus sp. MG754426]|uniref:6-phosphogluconolactonase n=1 Tax=unclassified Blastococcus TaxID=2619396 RepID=UPI001EF15D65|nr:MULTISPECIES: 6-phosphogluconolactonase [unclassified Blastococcus]MCF6509352.1 6-phosphogluconolactonase [Blastococcus sp. MG754426]MCF6513890.1 6-phosphogluconolactonase [Blastococcus sp. MG754427]